MSKYRLYVIFVLLVAAGLASVFLISRGYYPVAIVNRDFISARRFMLDYSAASLYYQNLLKTYGSEASYDRPKPDDLELAVMNQLVDESLIHGRARREVGSDLDYLVENKLGKFKDDVKLSEAATALYGLDKNDFVSEILIPQARRDILAGRLFLKGEKIDEWLAVARKSARVTIFSSKLHWDDGKVVLK